MVLKIVVTAIQKTVAVRLPGMSEWSMSQWNFVDILHKNKVHPYKFVLKLSSLGR